jgi:phosphoglycolate phosphatase-like HAD superfamily hydrolase
MAATALLFDLDGTIWDSYPCFVAALHGPLGLTADRTLEILREGSNAIALARECGLSNSRFSRLCRAAIAEIRLYPDARETLENLRGQARPLGIVTNLPGWLIEPILIELKLVQFFDSLIYAARKPGPGGINRALWSLGLHADPNIFYVGDMLSDAEAATRAAVSFAWASYGYADDCPAGAVASLKTFSDVLSL